MKTNLILLSLTSAFVSCSTVSKDIVSHATVADPEHYKTEFENEYVKVLRVKYGSRERSPMHSHSKLVGVHLTDAKGKFTSRDGTSQIRTIKAGDVGEGPAEIHMVENLTGEKWQTILVEFKKRFPHGLSKLKRDATKVAPTHYKTEMENDWVRIVRVKYGPNEQSHMHEHNPGVVVFLDSTKHQLINEDGSKVDADFSAGDVIWADAATHRAINLESKPLELVLFELK
jgi:quercetin dioxygenase-like cupin family protein